METGKAVESAVANPETVSAILEHVRDALDQQLAASDAIDNKALQVAGVGSVVIGLVAVGTTLTATHVNHRWVLVLAVIAYIAVMALAIYVVRVRTFAVARNADAIWETHWNSTVAQFEYATVDQIAEGYQQNAPILSSKARGVQWLVVLVAVEVGLIGLDLLWR